MSKRKAKYKSKAARATEAVPEEVLAEGSNGTAVHVQADEAGDEVRVEAEPTHEVVEAAEDEVVEAVEAAAAEVPEDAPVKGKRRKKAVVETVAEAAAPEETVEAVAEEAPAKGKRGKKRKQAEVEAASESTESNEELAELVDEAIEEEAAALADAADGEVVFDAIGDVDPGEVELQLTDDGAPIEAAADGTAGEGDDAEVEPEGVMPTSAASLDEKQLRHLVEALVFAADKPITVQRLRQLTRVSDVRRLETALTELQAEYTDRGVVLQQVSGGYQFRTQTKFSTWVQQLIQGRPVRLSRAQLETLAIVAYRQPITRPEIDDIRGVDSSATLKLLMDRALIRVLGKREEVGRPTLYGTTKEFLDFFSLGDLRELPTLREYSELTDESRKVMKDRLGIDPGGHGGGGGGSSGSGGGSDGSGGDSGGDPGSAPPSDDGGAPPGDSSPSDASAASDEPSASNLEASSDAQLDHTAATDEPARDASNEVAHDATVEHVSDSDSVFARYAHASSADASLAGSDERDALFEGDGAPELIGESTVEYDAERIGTAHAPVAFAADEDVAVDHAAAAQAAVADDAPVASDDRWPHGSMPIAKADYGLQPSPEADVVEHDAVVPTDEAIDDVGDAEPTRD